MVSIGILLATTEYNSTQAAATHTKEPAHIRITTPHKTPRMHATRGGSFSGASAAGSQQQAGASIDVDPTPKPIDVDAEQPHRGVRRDGAVPERKPRAHSD